MPAYTVTDPKGKKYTVNAPEGATKEQALQYFKENLDKVKPKEDTKKGEEDKGLLTKTAEFFVGDTSEMSGPEVYGRLLTQPFADIHTGTKRAVTSLAQAPQDFVEYLGETGALPGYRTKASREAAGEDTTPTLQEYRESLPKPETGGQALMQGVGQVAAGIAGAGNVTTAVKGLTPIVQGALIDMAAFGPEEKNLSNFIQETGLANQFNEALANNEDDIAAEARFKNVLEGGIIGASLESVMRGYKMAKKLATKSTKDAADTLFSKVIDTETTVKEASEGTSRRISELTDPDNIKIDVSSNVDKARAESRRLMQELNENVPDEIKLKPTDGNNVLNTKLGVKMTKGVTLAAESAAKGDPELAKALLSKSEAAYHKILDGILFNGIEVDYLPQVLQKYQLSPEEFGRMWKKTISTSGKNLAYLSHMNRRIGKLFKEDKAATGLFDEVNEALKRAMAEDGSVMDLIGFATSKIENTRRALLVTQWKTAMRNFRTQSARSAIGDIDEYFQATLRGAINNSIYGGRKILKMKPTTYQVGVKTYAEKPLTIAEELNNVHSIVKAGFHQLPIVSKKFRGGTKSRQIFDSFINSQQGAWAKARLNSSTMLEVYQERGPHGAFLNALNSFNRAQEFFFRRAAFEAKARQILKAKKMPFNVENLKNLSDKEMDEIIDHTLELTFARSPRTPFAKGFVRRWSRNPFATIINPFPRFHFANALPFFHEFSPVGFIKPEAVRAILHKDVNKIARIGSRTAIGTGMWYAGWQMYQNYGSGERWFEMQIPKDFVNSLSAVQQVEVGEYIENERKAGRVGESPDGSALMMDVRGDAPLTSMFFVMHGIDKMIKGGQFTDGMSPKDIAQQIAGLNRIAGSGLEFFDVFKAKDQDDVERILFNITAQYVGSFSVPVKQLKDVYSEIDANEAILRDLRQSPVYAPFLNNIPGLSQGFPPAYNPFHEGNIPEVKEPGFTLDNIEDQLAYDASVERYLKGLWDGGVGKPLFTQALGLTVKHKQIVEREVDRLGISKQTVYARSGDKRTDNLLNGYRGFFATRIIKPFLNTPQYKNAGDAQKKYLLENMIATGRRFSNSVLAGKHQGLFFKAINAGKDPDLLDLAKEFGADVETRLKTIEEMKMKEEPPQEVAPPR